MEVYRCDPRGCRQRLSNWFSGTMQMPEMPTTDSIFRISTGASWYSGPAAVPEDKPGSLARSRGPFE